MKSENKSKKYRKKYLRAGLRMPKRDDSKFQGKISHLFVIL